MTLTFGVIDYIIYGSYSEQLQQSKVELNNYGAFDIHFTLPDNVNLVSSMIQSPLAYYCYPTVDQYSIAGCEGKLFVGGCLNGAYVRWTNYGKKDEPVQTKVIVTDIDGNLIDNILVRCDVIGYGSEIKEDQNGLTIFEEIKDEQTLTIVSSNKGAVNIAYTPKLVKGLNF
ncbi:unnamed protein product [Rotaria socialis]|uniref:Uncharacterized protein n=1 Tax=Rotaria socialis TaxID=392032 RepID=A0A818FKV7_9BILA|nr:unnamed protein product [Rotaria socialis]